MSKSSTKLLASLALLLHHGILDEIKSGLHDGLLQGISSHQEEMAKKDSHRR
jgi:hypothetical protein